MNKCSAQAFLLLLLLGLALLAQVLYAVEDHQQSPTLPSRRPPAHKKERKRPALGPLSETTHVVGKSVKEPPQTAHASPTRLKRKKPSKPSIPTTSVVSSDGIVIDIVATDSLPLFKKRAKTTRSKDMERSKHHGTAHFLYSPPTLTHPSLLPALSEQSTFYSGLLHSGAGSGSASLTEPKNDLGLTVVIGPKTPATPFSIKTPEFRPVVSPRDEQAAHDSPSSYFFSPGSPEYYDVPSTPTLAPSVDELDQIAPLPSVDFSHLKILKSLGTGGFGSVCLVEYASTKYALKLFTDTESFERELYVYRLLNSGETLSKYFSPVYALVTSSRPIVLEGISFTGGILIGYLETTLYDIIRTMPISDVQARVIMFHLTQALNYLHFLGVVHSDLKPANILCVIKNTVDTSLMSWDEAFKALQSDIVVQIIDFGLSGLANEQSYQALASSGLGTAYYRSPELLLGYKKPRYSMDMWALGLIFIEMQLKTPVMKLASKTKAELIAGMFKLFRRKIEPPFPTKTSWIQATKLPGFGDKELAFHAFWENVAATRAKDKHSQDLYQRYALRNEIFVPFTRDYGTAAYQFLSKLVRLNPNERMTSYTAVNDPYISVL